MGGDQNTEQFFHLGPYTKLQLVSDWVNVQSRVGITVVTCYAN